MLFCTDSKFFVLVMHVNIGSTPSLPNTEIAIAVCQLPLTYFRSVTVKLW